MRQLLLSSLILFGSNWLGAIGMFGTNLLATPLLLWAGLELPSVILVLLIVGTAASIHLLTLTWREINWRQTGYMLLLTGLGLPLGYVATELLSKTLFSMRQLLCARISRPLCLPK